MTRAIEQDRILRPEQLPARSAEGLVDNQQSSGAESSFCPSSSLHPLGRAVPSTEAIERRRKLRALRVTEQRRARRWRVTVSNGENVFTMDSQQARRLRCWKRVSAWADALPKDNRHIRRAGEKLKIGPRMVMVTLTYENKDAWQPNHIRDFMKALKERLGKGLLAYAWVLEMQERGAPHYHLLLYVRRGAKIPKPDEAGLWKYGSTKIETVKKGPFYIVKYTGKEYQKNGLPAGARMFAVKIYAHALAPEEMLPFRLSAAPSWLRPHVEAAAALVGAELRWTRVYGGGWVIRDTGEFFASPFKLEHVEAVDSS